MILDLAGMMVTKMTILEGEAFFISNVIGFFPELEKQGYIRCYVDPTVEDIGIYNVFFAESGWVFYSMVRDFLPVKSRNLIENYVIKMLEKNDFDFQQYFQIVKNF